MDNVVDIMAAEAKEKGFDPSLLDQFEESEQILSPDEIDEQQGDRVKRQIISRENFELGMYPPKELFIRSLLESWDSKLKKWGRSFPVKRSTLRINGDFVHDSFEDYLDETKVRLDKNGKIILNENGSIKGYFQSSDLKAANKTPRHLFFKLAEDLLPKKERSSHFNLGEALHACLMEPTRFSRYVVEPQNDGLNTHSGCDKLIEFWKGKLLEVYVKQESGTIDGKSKYDATIEAISIELGIMKASSLSNFLEFVLQRLSEEKWFLKEGHNFNELLQKLDAAYRLEFGNEGFKFSEKTTEDPYLAVFKELGLKKNEAIGESKKDGFNSGPKTDLLNNLMDFVESFQVKLLEGPSEIFKSLQQKKEYIEALKVAADLESVTEKEFTIIKALELNAKTYGNGIIYKLAKHSHRECSAYLDDYNGTGIPLKVRPDMLQFKENIGVDAIISVKSTSSENIEKFFYDTAKYQYELSEGMYTEVLSKVTGREFRSVITIMYQTVEPWGVAVFWWTPEDIELGRHKFIQAFQTLKDTIEKGLWPGYDIYAEEDHFGVIDMRLPWWAYKSLDERNQEGLDHIHPTGDIE
jgi:hypothetical protein